jgi:hypothetical protein
MSRIGLNDELCVYRLRDASVIDMNGQAVKRVVEPVAPTGYRATAPIGTVMNLDPLFGLASTCKVVNEIEVKQVDCIPGPYQLVTPIEVETEPTIITWDWWFDRNWRDAFMGKPMSSYKLFKVQPDWTLLVSFRARKADDDRSIGAFDPKGWNINPSYDIHHSVWTRWWIEILPYQPVESFVEWQAKTGNFPAPNPDDPTGAGRVHMVSVYLADETRVAVPVLNRVPRRWPLERDKPTTIQRFDLEFNTSDLPICAGGPITSYGRNLVVLKGRKLDASLLVKP